MKKLINVLLLILLPGLAFADPIDGTENNAANGTASATTFVPAKDGYLQITDLNWRLDAGVTTGLIGIYRGDAKKSISSGTSASGTVLYFTNTGTQVAVDQYVIYYCSASQTYYLRKATVAGTTSITVSQSIADATTTNDFLWTVANSGAAYYRPVINTPSVTAAAGIWLPSRTPAAITIEGNTTACRIQWSGVRTH